MKTMADNFRSLTPLETPCQPNGGSFIAIDAINGYCLVPFGCRSQLRKGQDAGIGMNKKGGACLTIMLLLLLDCSNISSCE